MRVSYILFSLFIVFGVTVQLPQNGDKTKEILSVTTENNNVTVQEVDCQTVRNISGVCVIRARCDYGPGAIDFTLYTPQWYKRPCKVNEACCPLKFLVEEKKPTKPIDSFEFDDDD